MLARWDEISKETGQSLGFLTAELHGRISQPLFAIATALFGFAVLISSGFSRFGTWREVFAAFATLLLLDSFRAALTDPIRDNPDMWPLAYLPSLVGVLLTVGLLAYSSGPNPLRKRAAA